MNKQDFEVGRIAAISDGVFAIAMTLLVLDIDVPKFDGTVSVVAFREALLLRLPNSLSWLISFAILVRMWVIQAEFLKGGEHRSLAFVGMNFIFLGAVSFIPFPTALVSEHPEKVFAVIIFSADFAVAGLALGGLWYLSGGHKNNPHASSTKRVILMLPVMAFLTSVIAFVDTRIGIVVLIIWPFLSMTRHWEAKKK